LSLLKVVITGLDPVIHAFGADPVGGEAADAHGSSSAMTAGVFQISNRPALIAAKS
jgi:hypothetical protein